MLYVRFVQGAHLHRLAYLFIRLVILHYPHADGHAGSKGYQPYFILLEGAEKEVSNPGKQYRYAYYSADYPVDIPVSSVGFHADLLSLRFCFCFYFLLCLYVCMY